MPLRHGLGIAWPLWQDVGDGRLPSCHPFQTALATRCLQLRGNPQRSANTDLSVLACLLFMLAYYAIVANLQAFSASELRNGVTRKGCLTFSICSAIVLNNCSLISSALPSQNSTAQLRLLRQQKIHFSPPLWVSFVSLSLFHQPSLSL